LETEFEDRFLRVHRNALVAKAHVRGIERDANGHQFVRLDGIDDLVEVSRRQAPVIRRLLKSRSTAGP
jgi:two-component system response regulator AlgR